MVTALKKIDLYRASVPRGACQKRYPSDNFTNNFFVSAHSNTALIGPNDSTIYL